MNNFRNDLLKISESMDKTKKSNEDCEYKCKMCGKEFENANDLEEHINEHDG